MDTNEFKKIEEEVEEQTAENLATAIEAEMMKLRRRGLSPDQIDSTITGATEFLLITLR